MIRSGKRVSPVEAGAISPGEALTALSGINSRLRMWIECQDPEDVGAAIDPPPDARVLLEIRKAATRIALQTQVIEDRCRRGEIRAETEAIIERVEDNDGLAEDKVDPSGCGRVRPVCRSCGR